MATTLSSRWTPFYKFVVPVLVVAGVGVGAWRTVLHPKRAHPLGSLPPDQEWMRVIAIMLVARGGR